MGTGSRGLDEKKPSYHILFILKTEDTKKNAQIQDFHNTRKKTDFYSIIRKVNNYFGEIPTNRTSCRYLDE